MSGRVDQKLLRATKFPKEFNEKVDTQKINIEVIKKWIAGKISDILGSEDDVVIELCFSYLEGSRFPDIKSLQINLTGFLEQDTANFCKELWDLCLSAQQNPQGVPQKLLEEKKLELIQEKIAAEKAAENARKRREEELEKDRKMRDTRERERSDRGRDGGGFGRSNRGRNGYYGGRERERDREQRPRSRSSSPPRRTDTYIPRQKDGRGEHTRARRPSPRRLSRSPSRSRTPPKHRERRSRSPRRSYKNRSRDSSSSRERSLRRRRSPPRRRKDRSRSRSSSVDRPQQDKRSSTHSHSFNKADADAGKVHRPTSRSVASSEMSASASPIRKHDQESSSAVDNAGSRDGSLKEET